MDIIRIPPLPLLLCNIEANAESISLVNWHVACCRRCVKY